jgi:LuxR family transcriptional regulator, maltose regulon positive regulatory protein
MPAPLQKTKLFLPTPREQMVERARLLERLDGVRAEGCRAALICAPAGSGKTTVVTQWLCRCGWPTAWVSLDARDNTPPRFFAYLIAAVQTILPGVGLDALSLLDLPGASLDEIVTVLANDLTGSSKPFLLVLDDFHTITNPAVHQALDLLLDAQPPRMRLVLITREDPALQLARRRARGQVVELRQEDLRFSQPEALAFLNESMGLGLTTEQAQALEARTEGWIAGLQMAALSLQRAPETERFIRDFSGSHRFILDYLMEEVLARQAEEVQRFLLETSILERMNAGLCAAVTGRAHGEAQKLLEGLAKANLFVIPLDEERQWFRYHHLFNDLLLGRLQTEDASNSAVLYRRASDWYEQNGDPRLAVEYALKAQDMALAADLIERHIMSRWETVDFDFFMQVNRLPPELVLSRPSLCLHSAWTCVILGQHQRILVLVDAAERRMSDPARPPEPSDPANRAFARSLRAYLEDFDNQPVELGGWLEESYRAIPDENTGMRNSVAVVLGGICFNEAEFDRAAWYFQDALQRDKRVNGTNAVPIATTRLVTVLRAQGQLKEAERLVRENIDYINQRGKRRFYISGALHTTLAEILLEWNRLDEAEQEVREGLRLLEDWPVLASVGFGYAMLARIQAARGNRKEARLSLSQAEERLRHAALHSGFNNTLEHARIMILIAEQDQSALRAWAREQEPAAELEPRFRFESRQLDLCRAWLATNQTDEAAALLEQILAGSLERKGSRILILSLLVTARSSDPRSARPLLEEALLLGEPEDCLRTFIDAGDPMRQILEDWLKTNTVQSTHLREYARRVLDAFEESPAKPKPTPGANLPEPLSERELEVLALIAQGLTNGQIAERLVISVRTVKKHVENIDGKLGAQNRTQAVARARGLGILE